VKAKRPPPARHKWVRPWLTAHGDAMHRLVAETLAAADGFEAEHFPRTRRRRPADRQNHEALVRALVVNLAHASLSPTPSGRLAIRAGNAPKAKTRYDHPAFGKGVRPLLIAMHEAGLLDFRLPVAMRGEVSSIAPTDAFASRVRELGIGLSDFSHDGDDDGEEVLVLTRKADTRAAPSTDRIDYEDTAETNALREEVRRVNAFLAAADIDFVQDGLQPHIDPHVGNTIAASCKCVRTISSTLSPARRRQAGGRLGVGSALPARHIFSKTVLWGSQYSSYGKRGAGPRPASTRCSIFDRLPN
jgi:hypothetical protein